jgi:hypothetical protein
LRHVASNQQVSPDSWKGRKPSCDHDSRIKQWRNLTCGYLDNSIWSPVRTIHYGRRIVTRGTVLVGSPSIFRVVTILKESQWNMVQGPQSGIMQLMLPRYVLIDSSHADTSHRCRRTECCEIWDASEQLGVTSDDLPVVSTLAV